MCGFEQACGNVCDIAKGITISLSINIPMPGMQKPTCLGGEPMRQEQVKDFRGQSNGHLDKPCDKMDDDQDDKKNLAFIKPGDKPDKEDEDDKDERWH